MINVRNERDMRALTSKIMSTLLALSCSGGGAATAPSGSSCDADRQRAIARVQAAVDANQTCSTDADCKQVSVSGSCFDACTRAANAAGESAVTKAIAEAEQSECKTFAGARCQLIHPPCAPPQPPTCQQGKCQ